MVAVLLPARHAAYHFVSHANPMAIGVISNPRAINHAICQFRIAPNYRQRIVALPFVVDYGFMQGKTVTLPMPWDATYLNRWFAFVRVLAQRYDSNPTVVNIPAAGPTSISEEMSLPNDPTAVAKWKQLGYTVEKYKGA